MSDSSDPHIEPDWKDTMKHLLSCSCLKALLIQMPIELNSNERIDFGFHTSKLHPANFREGDVVAIICKIIHQIWVISRAGLVSTIEMLHWKHFQAWNNNRPGGNVASKATEEIRMGAILNKKLFPKQATVKAEWGEAKGFYWTEFLEEVGKYLIEIANLPVAMVVDTLCMIIKIGAIQVILLQRRVPL